MVKCFGLLLLFLSFHYQLPFCTPWSMSMMFICSLVVCTTHTVVLAIELREMMFAYNIRS